MNDADVGKQVQQMVRFILQEADEKASEITVAAEEVRTTDLALIFTTSQHTLFSDSFGFFSFQSRSAGGHLDDLNLCICILHAGVQHREAAAGGVGETEGEAGVRAQGEAGGRPQEDVREQTIDPSIHF